MVRLEALAVAAALGYTGRQGPVVVGSRRTQATVSEAGTTGEEGGGEGGASGGEGSEAVGGAGGGAGGRLAGEGKGRESAGWAYRRLAALFPASHAILLGGPPTDDLGASSERTRPLHVRILWSPDKDMGVGSWGDYFEPLTLVSGRGHRDIVLDVQTDAAEFGPPPTFRTFKARPHQ